MYTDCITNMNRVRSRLGLREKSRRSVESLVTLGLQGFKYSVCKWIVGSFATNLSLIERALFLFSFAFVSMAPVIVCLIKFFVVFNHFKAISAIEAVSFSAYEIFFLIDNLICRANRIILLYYFFSIVSFVK